MVIKTARHKSVLLKEAVDNLNLRSGAVVVDATLGGGGHALALLERILPDGLLIALDVDKQAIERFEERLRRLPWTAEALREGRIRMFHRNYSELEQVLRELSLESVSGIVADLGFSSDQIDDPERGLSFRQDGALDMRLNQSDSEETAERIIRDASEEEIERILRDYGEERFAKRIARAIGIARKDEPIKTTRQLAEIVERAVPKKYAGRIHPATKTFQALRIAVNGELEHLKTFLPQAAQSLGAGGRLAVITFHSGEDRIVKQFFRENARGCVCPPNFPVCRCGQTASLRILTSRPIMPAEEEVEENPRARSAKLRIAEKLEIV